MNNSERAYSGHSTHRYRAASQVMRARRAPICYLLRKWTASIVRFLPVALAW